MWLHFVHLFWRVIHGMPLLLSSNWPDKFFGIWIFVVLQVLLAISSRHHMQRWWENRYRNLATGIAAVVIGYISLFAWSTVQTIYDNYHDATGRWQSVVRKKTS